MIWETHKVVQGIKTAWNERGRDSTKLTSVSGKRAKKATLLQTQTLFLWMRNNDLKGGVKSPKVKAKNQE